MQKEVALRLVAQPGSKSYGRLTLGVRYAADVRLAFSIPPGCFTPRPEVDSGVVVMDFHAQASGADEAFLYQLFETAFSQRRKTLVHLLLKDPRLEISRHELTEIFGSLQMGPSVRGEELLLKDFIQLANRLKPYRSRQTVTPRRRRG